MKYIFVFLLFTINIIVAKAQQWELVSPFPNPPVLTLSVPDSIHLKGFNGRTFLKSDDGGITWVPITLTQPAIKIFFLDDLNGWLVTSSSDLLHTADGGINWTEYSFTSLSSIGSLQFVTPDTGFCTAGSYLYTTYNAGATWTIRVPPFNGSGYINMKFIDSQNGWVAQGNDTNIFKTNDGGITWSTYSFSRPLEITNSLNVLSFADSLHGWLSLNSDSILKTVDGGVSWQITPVIFSNASLVFSDSLNGLAVSQGNAFRTIDGGINWNICFDENINLNWQADIFGSSYFLSKNGVIYFSHDSYNWTRIGNVAFTGVSASGNYFQFVTPKTGVFVTNKVYDFQFDVYHNEVYLTTDSAYSWRLVYSGDPPCDKVVMVSDSVFYCTFDGQIKKTTNAFQTLTTIGQTNGTGIFFNDSLKGIFSNKYTADGGGTWNGFTVSGGNGYFNSINFINYSEGWAVDSQNVFKTIDGGLTWNNIFTSSGNPVFRKVLFTDSFNGFLLNWSATENSILKTIDGGLTWDSLNFPFRSIDFHFSNSQKGWVTSQEIASNAGIFFTSDGGATFTRQDSSHVTLLSFVDSTIAFAAGFQILLKADNLDNNNTLTDEINKFNHFTISPNPASSKININAIEEINFVELFNSDGKLILKNKVKALTHSILIQNLSEGLYVLKVNFKNRSETEKMLIAR